MTEQVNTSNNDVSNSLPLKQGSTASLERQFAEALAEKYGDKLGNFTPEQQAQEEARRSTPSTPQPSQKSQELPPEPEGSTEPEDEEDEFVKIFGKKASPIQTDGEEEHLLPSELTLDDLAEHYKTTPEKLIEALRVKTKVGSDERSLSLKEVVKGYQTDKYVTQKSQALAEKEREIEAIRNEFGQKKSELDQNMYVANGLLQQQYERLQTEFNQKDWDRLRIEDPTEYAILKQDFAEKRGRIDYEMRQLGQIYWQEQDKIKAQEQKVKNQSMQQALQRQEAEKQKLYEIMPNLRDKAKADMFHKELISYLEATGVPAEKYNSEIFSEAWVYKIMNDAMLYRRMTKGDLKEKIVNAVAKQPKSSARGTAEVAKPQAREQDAYKKLTNARSIDAALEWLEARGTKNVPTQRGSRQSNID